MMNAAKKPLTAEHRDECNSIAWGVLVWSAWRNRSLLEAGFALNLLVFYAGVGYVFLVAMNHHPD